MPANVKVKIDTRRLDEIRKNNPARADRIVRSLAYEMEKYVKIHFTSPSPSNPGESPAVDTGTLKNSVHTEQIRPMLYRVVDGVLYGFFLEFGTRFMKARPFFAPAAREIEKLLKEFFKGLV